MRARRPAFELRRVRLAQSVARPLARDAVCGEPDRATAPLEVASSRHDGHGLSTCRKPHRAAGRDRHAGLQGSRQFEFLTGEPCVCSGMANSKFAASTAP